jgi:uncharacterized membrane protein
MTNESENVEPNDLSKRIKEFGKKSTQLLLFLTFAILGAATVRSGELPANPALIRAAMWWWVFAVFPVLLGVLPVKEFGWNNRCWYCFVVWAKFLLLWAAVVFSGVGAIQFLRAVS